jgi:branched-chain amino acid transport system permease protein
MSAEVLIMTILGGIYTFLGPIIGAGVLLYLRMLVGSYTDYWPFIMGIILSFLVFFAPEGVTGLFGKFLLALKKRWQY